MGTDRYPIFRWFPTVESRATLSGRSFFIAFASIWRMRSRLREKRRLISSNECSRSVPIP